MSVETPIEKACRCWGEDIPDWVEGLARACMDSSQNKVAKAMGYSASLVSSVLSNKYPGDLERIEAVYRGVYERAVVECPVWGEMALNVCRDWRKKLGKSGSANSLNVTMFHACRRCPLNKEEQP